MVISADVSSVYVEVVVISVSVLMRCDGHVIYPTLQRKKTVSAHLLSEQILPFGFAWQHSVMATHNMAVPVQYNDPITPTI